MNKQLLQEVKTAYADSTMEWELAVKIRNLGFRASQACSPAEAFDILKAAIPKGYNEFTAALVKKFPAHAQITIAREGSVCMYVTGVQAHEPELPSREELMADEYDWTGNALRIWWD